MTTSKCLIVTLFLALLGTLAGSMFDAPRAVGQEPAAAAPPAAGEAAPAAPVAGDPKPVEKSRFMWFIRSSGLIGLGILILSIYFVATIIRLFIELRPIVAMPPEEIAQAETLLQSRDYQGLYDFTSKSHSF